MFDIQKALATAKRVFPHTLFIGIDGHAGSGKSSLAQVLADTFKAEIIHIDDFATWDQIFPWHTRLITDVFLPISKGADMISYAKTSWWEGHNPEPATNQPVTPVMLLEGVDALRRELRPYLSVHIFVDTPEATCLARGIKRDLGVSKPLEEIETLWHQWREGEDRYMTEHTPKLYADVIFDGTVPFTQQVNF
jgi:uridine kinase